MKICIVQQNQYVKMGHAIALHLSEKYGVDKFLAYVISPGAARFIRKQNDIKYARLLVDHELHQKIKSEKVDMAFLKRFEGTYSPPPLWQYLYVDRKLMMSIGPKEETTTIIDPLYDYDTLLKALQIRAKEIEKMLLEEKPDVVLFFALGAVSHMILYHVAKKLGIKTVGIDFPRYESSLCLSESYKTITGVEDSFRSGKHDGIYLQKAETFIKNFRKTGSLQIEYMDRIRKDEAENYGIGHPIRFIRSLHYFMTQTRNYFANRKLFTYGTTDQNPLRFITQQIKRRWRRFVGTNDLTILPIPNEEYCYYPLHYEPEMATLVLSPFYFDQVELIRIIARSLPIQMKLYVKEHPAMKGRRTRDFYKTLLKIPNVRLIRETTPGIELIRNALLITTITSTAGWEGALLRKPVITFGDVFYNALPSVEKVEQTTKLPEIFRIALRKEPLREDILSAFVASVIEHAFHFDFFGLWYENDINKIKNSPDIALFCEKLMAIVSGKSRRQ